MLRELHWLKVPERIQLRLCVLAHCCLHGTASPFQAETLYLTTDVRWCSSPPQIGQHVYSLRVVNSPVHTWRPGISSGCCSWLEHPAIWCQIHDVLSHVSSATQDRALRGVLWITGHLPPFCTVWPKANGATFSLYSAPLTVYCNSVTIITFIHSFIYLLIHSFIHSL